MLKSAFIEQLDLNFCQLGKVGFPMEETDSRVAFMYRNKELTVELLITETHVKIFSDEEVFAEYELCELAVAAVVGGALFHGDFGFLCQRSLEDREEFLAELY